MRGFVAELTIAISGMTYSSNFLYVILEFFLQTFMDKYGIVFEVIIHAALLHSHLVGVRHLRLTGNPFLLMNGLSSHRDFVLHLLADWLSQPHCMGLQMILSCPKLGVRASLADTSLLQLPKPSIILHVQTPLTLLTPSSGSTCSFLFSCLGCVGVWE